MMLIVNLLFKFSSENVASVALFFLKVVSLCILFVSTELSSFWHREQMPGKLMICVVRLYGVLGF